MQMEIDQEQSFQHKLGFFPGAYIQNLPDDDDIDGVPDCEGAFQMMDTIDRLVAQSNKGLLANMDPTLVIVRDMKTEQMSGPLKKGSDNAIDVGPGGSAQYLEISGSGLTAGRDKAEFLKQEVYSKTAFVEVDDQAAQAQSAKALEIRFAPMITKAGRMRTQYGEGLRQIFDGVLNAARKWQGKDMYPGNRKAVFNLPPRIEEIDPAPDNPDIEPIRREIDRHPGQGGIVQLSWGPFFAPTPNDVQTGVNTLVMAKEGSLLDEENAIKKAAVLFDIKDPKELQRKIQEDKAVAKKEQQEMMGMGDPGMGGLMGDELGFGMDEPPPGEEPPPEDPLIEKEPQPPSGTPGGFA